VGENIVGGDKLEPEYESIPSNVYAVPTLAKAAGRNFTARKSDMRGWRSARTYAETVAFSKVLVENGSGRILGAHMVGHGAEEVIHLFAFAIKHGVTAKSLADTVYAYPTFSSDLKFML